MRFCIALLVGLLSAPATAAVINVPGDLPQIQAAINAAVNGDEIVVQPGTYHEVINFLGKAINLHSASGNPADTIIDGTGFGNSVVLCVNGEGAGTILEGFTITGGTGNTSVLGVAVGGGMFNDGSSPTVSNCTFSENSAELHGGGMFNNQSSSPTITNCTFNGNTTSNGGGGGGGMFNDGSSPTVTNCTFNGNSSAAAGGMGNQISSNPTVTNCTFSGNSGVFNGGGMGNYSSSSPIVTNCTFSGNAAFVSGGGGMFNNQSSSPTVTNCILWGDGPNEIVNFDSGSTPTISFSNVQGGLGAGGIDGGGNIFTNPFFIDADGADNIIGTPDDDLWLTPGSPCIDAGDNTTPGLTGITTDHDGNPRFIDDPSVVDTGNGTPPIVDMGAYERQVDPCLCGVSCLVSNITQGTGFNCIQVAIDAAVNGDEIVVEPGTYFEVINYLGKAINLHSASGNPADTIIDGTGLFAPVVTCSSGEGVGAILEGFTITGGTGHADIFGQLFGGGMFNNASSPTVTNCTFSGNSAKHGGGMYNSNTGSHAVTNCTFSGNTASSGGGGMTNTGNSNPTVTNCTFSGNTATLGGGMINSGSNPTVTNCTFNGNTAPSGGGMYNNTNNAPTVTNCTFSGNSGLLGGGMRNAGNSNPTVTNCTFSGNTASNSGGGIINQDSSPAVTSCILWGDSPNEIVNSGTGSPTISFSNVQGGLGAGSIDGGGNIFTDPVFVDATNDDLRLASGSPCTDAGDNTASGLTGITTDLDGNPRFIDDPGMADTGNGTPPIVDMGAYERQAICPADISRDGSVNVTDLLQLLAAWGVCPVIPPSFQGLGDLPGSNFQSFAYGVSADGSVVVGKSNSASGEEAFRWTSAGGMVGLGDLPGGSPIFQSRANDVSADGSVVVGVGRGTSGFEAFRWTSGGGMVGLGDLAGVSISSVARGVSDDGLAVVGQGNSASGLEAFRWTSAGGMVGLGDLPGGLFQSDASGVSTDGSVVVGGSTSDSIFEAFRWTSGGGMVGLGDLAGGDFLSIANGVSADGSVVVGLGTSASGQEAIRWTSASGMVSLGDLPGGIFSSQANGVSADGSLVVGNGNSATGLEAFIWDATNGMQGLKAVLESLGLDLTEWTLTTATSISADGTTIVGFGTNPDGFTEAYIAVIPGPGPCPADISGDGNVNVTDLLALLAAWGVCP